MVHIVSALVVAIFIIIISANGLVIPPHKALQMRLVQRVKRWKWGGNHCGPGYGLPNIETTGPFDQCCYDHDRCIEERGWWSTCHFSVVRCFARNG